MPRNSRETQPEQCDEIALNLFEDGHRQDGRTGGEVVDALNRWHEELQKATAEAAENAENLMLCGLCVLCGYIVTRCKSRMSLFPS